MSEFILIYLVIFCQLRLSVPVILMNDGAAASYTAFSSKPSIRRSSVGYVLLFNSWIQPVRGCAVRNSRGHSAKCFGYKVVTDIVGFRKDRRNRYGFLFERFPSQAWEILVT